LCDKHYPPSEYKAILIKVVAKQSGKANTSIERIAGKFINFLAIPSKPFALVFDISALRGDNLN
jgi:hypothetical protein